jgi:hypothetical protein
MEQHTETTNNSLTDGEVIGEGSVGDIRRPFARHANKVLKKLSGSANTIIDLGPEHGELPVKDFRVRDNPEQEGTLIAYIRRQTGEHKAATITVSVIALGAVATGIYSGIRLKKK